MTEKKENREVASVPFVVHEAMMARLTREIRYLWIACVASYVALASIGIAWILI